MPATVVFANYPQTTVSSGGVTGPVSGTQEVWTVVSPSSFPAASTGTSQFHIADVALPTELIAVTNTSGASWTVTRGAEGTTPVAHSAGFTIRHVVSSGAYTSFIQSPANSVMVSGTASTGLSVIASSATAASWTANLPGGPASGDLSGTYPSPTVMAINGVAVSGTPASGQLIVAQSSSTAMWAAIATADTTPHTVTQAVATDLVTPYTIPANDALAGTTYRLTCGGTGTWGSTQQNLTLSPFFGTVSTISQVVVGAAQIPISQPIRWAVTTIVSIVTAGTAGTMLSYSGGNLIQGTTGGAAIALAVSTTANVAVNTTISNPLSLKATWASITGAPTITCVGSLMERLGPR